MKKTRGSGVENNRFVQREWRPDDFGLLGLGASPLTKCFGRKAVSLS